MRSHGVEISDHVWMKLRKCQQKAIVSAITYLKAPEKEKSCLVSLPTGAGKTGVICVISNLKKFKRVLVLSHRRAVVDQIAKELDGGFYKKIVPGKDLKPKKVYKSLDGTLNKGVFVNTFQKLGALDKAELSELNDKFDVLIVDEGHAEPSPEWSDIARSFTCKKVIITATPYRNDLFRFDVDSKSGYIYTFKQAVANRVLEEPFFETIEFNDIPKAIKGFLSNNSKAKCIVKCKEFNDVKRFHELLGADFKTLSVHHQYTKEDGENKKNNVPAGLGESDYEVIIHQRKIDEGVDIPSAKLLILSYPVSSGRELVQTVGRVVRKYSDIPAKVFEIGTSGNRQLWENYREFDDYLSKDGNAESFLASLDTDHLLKEYLGAFPDISYFERGFRRKFDLGDFSPEKSLKFPLASVCFIEKSQGFEINSFVDQLYYESTFDGELCDIRNTDFGIKVLISITFNNSRYLSDSLFFEPKLEVTLVKDLGDRIALLDSRSRDYSGKVKDYKTGMPVDVNNLLKLAGRADKTKTKETSSRSIGTSERRPEAIQLKGGGLDNIAGSQAYSNQALSILKVENWNALEDSKHSSYYLGIGSGRVSDQKNRNFNLESINFWIDEVESVLNSNNLYSSSLLSSYAKPLNVVPDSSPVAVIFDFSDFPHDIALMKGQTCELTLSNSFVYFRYNGNGHLDEASGSLPFETSYYPSEAEYKVELGDWSSEYTVQVGEEIRSVDEFFGSISIKVLFEDGCSFLNGKFYGMTLPSEVGFDIDTHLLGKMIIPLTELAKSGMSEKDEENTELDDFGKDSVFRLVDKLKVVSQEGYQAAECGPFYSAIPEVDLVLCTDMGTEPADFVISSPRKLVFIHIKCGGTTNPRSSAGSLAEVGGQAIKNLAYLVSTNGHETPKNYSSYSKAWSTGTADAKPLEQRVRLYKGIRFESDDLARIFHQTA